MAGEDGGSGGTRLTQPKIARKQNCNSSVFLQFYITTESVVHMYY